eukprot:14804217-Heterocapsa_arctica.AAC.1
MAAVERHQRGVCCAAPPTGESSEDGARRAAGGESPAAGAAPGLQAAAERHQPMAGKRTRGGRRP